MSSAKEVKCAKREKYCYGRCDHAEIHVFDRKVCTESICEIPDKWVKNGAGCIPKDSVRRRKLVMKEKD